jgi:molybdate transport system ATP-binding protein
MLHFDCRFEYPGGFRLELAFTAGEGVTALVGPSGSGKTTTLALIAGLLTPTCGRIALGERVFFDAKQQIDLAPEARAIGLVFQDYQLFPHLTIADNLRYGLLRSPSHRHDFGHLVEVLELSPLLDRYPATLSGGERQRTALGRAILRGPELLLLDEPLSALDSELKSSIRHYLRRTLAEYRLPTLLVTHNLDDVADLATQVVRLEARR